MRIRLVSYLPVVALVNFIQNPAGSIMHSSFKNSIWLPWHLPDNIGKSWMILCNPLDDSIISKQMALQLASCSNTWHWDLEGAVLARIMANSLVDNFQKLGLKPAGMPNLELNRYKTNKYSQCNYQVTLFSAFDKRMQQKNGSFFTVKSNQEPVQGYWICSPWPWLFLSPMPTWVPPVKTGWTKKHYPAVWEGEWQTVMKS